MSCYARRKLCIVSVVESFASDFCCTDKKVFVFLDVQKAVLVWRSVATTRAFVIITTDVCPVMCEHL
jgi:hypothetical protein